MVVSARACQGQGLGQGVRESRGVDGAAPRQEASEVRAPTVRPPSMAHGADHHEMNEVMLRRFDHQWNPLEATWPGYTDLHFKSGPTMFLSRFDVTSSISDCAFHDNFFWTCSA